MSLSVDIRHALGDFALDVQFETTGGVTALFGRSGAGKTSVVRAVAGLLRPETGQIALDGDVLSGGRFFVPPFRRRMGYVFQEPRLFPHLNVRRNLTYAGANGFDRIVDLLGLEPLLDRRPAALSGGEAQRVAIGRALLSDPRMLLMDEPLAALDSARRAEILPFLERLRAEAGLPILYVSHSVAEVARLAQDIVVLDNGQVAHNGPAAQVLADPALTPLIGVREAGAVLSATLTCHTDDGLSALEVSAGTLLLPRIAANLGARLQIRVPAQDVIIALTPPLGISALNVLPATVRALHGGDGPGVMVQLQAGDDLLLARVTRRSAQGLGLRPGLACHIVLKSVAVAAGDVGLSPGDRTLECGATHSTP